MNSLLYPPGLIGVAWAEGQMSKRPLQGCRDALHGILGSREIPRAGRRKVDDSWWAGGEDAALWWPGPYGTQEYWPFRTMGIPPPLPRAQRACSCVGVLYVVVYVCTHGCMGLCVHGSIRLREKGYVCVCLMWGLMFLGKIITVNTTICCTSAVIQTL